MKLKYLYIVSIIVLLIYLAIMYPISGIKALPSILVAWGTLILAIATFSLVRQTIEHEKSRKQDELNRENRSRKEGWLDDILNWSADIKSPTLGGGISFSTLIGKELIGAFTIVLGSLLSKSEYITHISDALDKNLNTSVKNTISKLEIFDKACTDLLISPDDTKDLEPKSKHFAKCNNDAVKSANEVIRIASKLKASLLL